MFTGPEKRILTDPYFTVLRETDSFFEIQSNNTKHCWIVMKAYFEEPGFQLILYHKHTKNTAHYHRHAYARTVKSAVQKIKSHDDYVLHPENYTLAAKEHSA